MLHMPHGRAAAASTAERRRRDGRLGGGRSLDIKAFLFLNQTVGAAVIAAGRGAVYAAPMAAVVVADLDFVVGSHLLDVPVSSVPNKGRFA
jgi:hypothetical protein